MTAENIPAPGQNFTRKAINVSFNVVNQDGTEDTFTLSDGHRIEATITMAGMSTGTKIELKIEGMDPMDMARLSHIGNAPNVPAPLLHEQSLTTIVVKAGTFGTVLPVVFYGLVTESFASFKKGSALFTVKAETTANLVMKAPKAYSFPNGTKVVDMLSDICKDSQITLIDHGGWKSGSVLHNHYTEGSIVDQIKNIMHACGGAFNYVPLVPLTHGETSHYVPGTGEMHIWGPTYSEKEKKKDENIPLISAQTGMIGYPEYSLQGINFSCMFRSDIKFFYPIRIKSGYMPAGWETLRKDHKNRDGQTIPTLPTWCEGLWLPFAVTHTLSSEKASGSWFTHIECQRSSTEQAPPPFDNIQANSDKKPDKKSDEKAKADTKATTHHPGRQSSTPFHVGG